MTTMTSIQISESMQALIDIRLDTIDRMLLGRLPRGERLEIVREVESQIFELLQEQESRAAGDELTREDVLAVLGRLDPPEAYLPENLGGEPTLTTRPRPLHATPRRVPDVTRTAARSGIGIALASGVLGIVSLMLVLATYPLMILLVNLFPGSGSGLMVVWFLCTGLAFVGSTLAIVLAAYSRLKGVWAVAGLVIGITAWLGSLGLLFLGILGL